MLFTSGLENDETVNDETFLNRMRHWRNKELMRTDWTQLADSVCDKAVWATYRQALRDLPSSNSDPRKIELPEVPA